VGDCLVALVGAHPCGRLVLLPLWEPTLWANGFVVGAHPVGDCLHCLCGSPPRGRWVCLGGLRAIAHRSGLLQTALRPFVFVGAHPVGDFPAWGGPLGPTKR
jgi:hypothetical protein